MYPLQDFQNWHMPHDDFNDVEPKLRLDDLLPVDNSLPIRLSYCMGITDYRRVQLMRTLETLARQTWKEFEVLIGDNGSTQNLGAVCNMFSPYLRIKYVRTERQGYAACPSKAFKSLFPICEGDVISIAQPELMMKPDACNWLWSAHQLYTFPPDSYYMYAIDELGNENKTGRPPTIQEDEWSHRWVTLKPGFLNKAHHLALNVIDWHSNISNIEKLPEYWDRAPGLSNRPNTYWSERTAVPWWFCGSALADDPIWHYMPETIGHASIDLWLLNYRKLFNYVDIMPKEVMCYHQDHIRGSISPIGEQDSVSLDSIRRACEQNSIRKES
jgi:hypothetical protein